MTTPLKRIIPCPTPFTDHIYKTAHGVDVPLRIWPAEDETGTNAGARPWLLWLHGGGFVAGKHAVPNTWVIPAFRSRGIHVVSAAYRLAPHVGFSDILSDVADALTWCRAHLPSILNVDVDAYILGGDSAGATLALFAGYKLSPRPRVVLDVYGLADTLEQRAPLPAHIAARVWRTSGKWSDDELRAMAAERDPAKAAVIAPWTWEIELGEEALRTLWGMEFEIEDEHVKRMDMFNLTMREDGLVRMPARKEEVEGDNVPTKERFSPVQSVEPTYPPTFFLHGERDRTVPVSHSKRMAEALRSVGVPTGEAYDPTGGHCFDNKIEGPEDEGWKYIIQCMDFIAAHIDGKDTPETPPASVQTTPGSWDESTMSTMPTKSKFARTRATQPDGGDNSQVGAEGSNEPCPGKEQWAWSSCLVL